MKCTFDEKFGLLRAGVDFRGSFWIEPGDLNHPMLVDLERFAPVYMLMLNEDIGSRKNGTAAW